jgi:hypothetical protein
MKSCKPIQALAVTSIILGSVDIGPIPIAVHIVGAARRARYNSAGYARLLVNPPVLRFWQ